jgi:hypothetical protein
MELPDSSRSDRSRSEGTPPATASRGGKLQRISSDTRGVISDLREWIDLRIDLAVRDVNDQLDDAASQAVLGVVLAVLGFFTGLFMLTTLAIGLGWWLGHMFWGFLIVFALLAVVSFAVLATIKRHPIIVETKLFRKYRGDRYRDGDSEERGPSESADA